VPDFVSHRSTEDQAQTLVIDGYEILTLPLADDGHQTLRIFNRHDRESVTVHWSQQFADRKRFALAGQRLSLLHDENPQPILRNRTRRRARQPVDDDPMIFPDAFRFRHHRKARGFGQELRRGQQHL
jgi:hypothetical protein